MCLFIMYILFPSHKRAAEECPLLFLIYSNFFLADGIQLHYIINHIGELLTILVLLELLISNTSIISNWMKYCKALNMLKQSPDNAEMTEEKLNSIIGAVNNITSKIMNDDIVQSSLQNLSSLRKSLVDKNCSLIATEFSHYLKQAIFNLDKLTQEQPTITNMYKCIKINALFVLSSHLFGNIDRRIFKSLMDLNFKVGI